MRKNSSDEVIPESIAFNFEKQKNVPLFYRFCINEKIIL